MTFWMIERSIGGPQWWRSGYGLPWTSDVHEAKRFPFQYMAEEALRREKLDRDPTVSVTPHTWLPRVDGDEGPLRSVPDPDKKQTADAPCKVCGEPIRLTFDTETLMRMCERRMCHGCSFWESIASKTDDLPTVIKGGAYWPGNGYGRRDLGMGGRRFDIEYFDGRRVTTYDLWFSGVVPEAFRDRLPDTARFLDGARRAQVGETTCFNPSNDKVPPYPLPNGKPAPWPYGAMVAQAIGAVARQFAAPERGGEDS